MSGQIDDSAIQVRYGYFIKLLNKEMATPLTAHEMYLAQNMSKIRSYETDYGINLKEFVHNLSTKVSIRDIIYLLIDAYNINAQENALDILESVGEQELKISTHALVEIFTETLDGALPLLLIDILGETPKEEVIYTRLPSGLNLDAMKNFK